MRPLSLHFDSGSATHGAPGGVSPTVRYTSPVRGSVSCLVVLAVTVAAPSVARAETVTAVDVTVDAEPECATESGFWRALQRRTDRLARGSGDAKASIALVIERSEGGARGALRVVRAGNAEGKRIMTGASCEDVVAGLSLVAALAFDPAARMTLDDAAAETPSAPTNALASPTPAAAPAREPAPASAAPPTREEPRAGAPRPPSQLRFGVGVGAGALAMGAPAVTVGYGGFAELGVDRAGLAPLVRVGILRADATSDLPVAGADLGWTLARASFCPLRVDLVASVGVRPCAAVDAGALTASARGVERARDRTRPWVAPAAALSVVWSVTRAAFVELQGRLAVPLVRDEVVVDPSVTLYRAPPVSPSGEIAAGWRFP
jgi:hypothetical protein